MKKLIAAVAVVAFSGTLFAQDPFVGTWKLDPAKTKYTTGKPAKEVTLTIEEQGGGGMPLLRSSAAPAGPIPVAAGENTVRALVAVGFELGQ